MWYSGLKPPLAPPEPPVIRTIPLFSSVAVWRKRPVFRFPVVVKVPVDGS